MLASLTTTAVSRGWPPTVYSRLVSQLRDSTDLGGTDAVLGVFSSLMDDNPPNPLLFEYICTLSSDPHSLIFFPILMKWIIANPGPRPQHLKDLISYVGRYAAQEWKLPQEYTDLTAVAESCKEITEQALSDSKQSSEQMSEQMSEADTKADGTLQPKSNELEVLAAGLSQSVIPQLFHKLPEWKPKIEPDLHHLGIVLKAEILDGHGRGSAQDSPLNSQEALSSAENRSEGRHSSRALRLLWLDWYLRTAQCFDFDCFRRQLDLVWPGDRETVISYELCVTALDVLASHGLATNSANHMVKPFITSALPLLLKKLNAEKTIDSVIARVLTTLDKAVVEAIEQRSPGIRADFAAACIDIALCDPTVMHALHRSHVVKPPVESSELPTIKDIISTPTLFLQLNPLNQSEVAQNILDTARGSTEVIGRHEMASLCAQIYRTSDFADHIFVHVSVRDFLEAVCEYANAASTIPDEDGGAGLVYSDLGVLLSTARWLCSRYKNLELPDGWAASYIRRKNFISAAQLSPEESSIMGQWIVGLFSGSGSGISDEMLRPFNELGQIIPVLIQQAVRAYRSAVIDRETLKSGLDYFVHPFSVTLFAPLVMHVLRIDLFEGTHPSTTLECLIFFLEMVLQKKTPEIDMGKAAVLGISKEIVADLATMSLSTSGNVPNGASTKKLADAFIPLVDALSQQVSPNFVIAAPASSSTVGETISLVDKVKQSTSALVTWQLTQQGVPTIPSCYRKAKAALGVDAAWPLVVEVAAKQSMDVLIAVLVSDSLWSRGSGCFIDYEQSQLSSTARAILLEYQNIFNEQRKLPNVVITNDSTRNVNNLQPEAVVVNSPTAAPVEQDNTATMETDNVMDTDANNDSTHLPANFGDVTGMPGSLDAFDGSIDNMSGPMATTAAANDFENDFVSQPMMNLADLDSAMDFAWD